MGRSSNQLSDYIPELARSIVQTLDEQATSNQIALVGFGETMKWVSRLLSKQGTRFELFDDRPKFVGYDCGNKKIKALTEAIEIEPKHIALCHDYTEEAKIAILTIANSTLKSVPTTIGHPGPFAPFENSKTLECLLQRAQARAISVNTPDRLYNLLQLVKQTASIPGCIIEIGTFSGGSASLILETLCLIQDQRELKLFDSFAGIPTSPLGIDHRWSEEFANISFSEVQAAFKNSSQVDIIAGEVTQTVPKQSGPFSLIHFDADTLHATQSLIPDLWGKLSIGGVLLFDDYGFYPNCLPLTAWVDNWAKTLDDAFVFRLPSNGCFLIKR